MRILWDEHKRLANLAKHGMDFATLDWEFFTKAIIRPGHSGRLLAIGWYRGQLMTAVVFRPLGSEAISVVSMRPASLQERRLADG